MARRRAYRMTPARRAALRKAQIASARKRRGRTSQVKSHIQRNKKRYVVAGGVAVAVGGIAVGQDYTRNVRVYHNTSYKNAHSIKTNGLTGVKRGSYSHVVFGETPGQVFVTKGRNTAKMFGDTVVKVKMNRREFNRHAIRDHNMDQITKRAYSINQRHLKGKKMKVKLGGSRQQMQYYSLFPNGTKESYDPDGYQANMAALKAQVRQARRVRYSRGRFS